ncbi:HPr family phosphocarrier protein [Paenibacillus rigui]|uniref:PTS sugar transporter n=1 Tax=Paenibacillus rigui TaxID=554312 RepID=A0A229UVP3_9BACL|nr:HPr family phosphocarrier protein [Paenibacillus rigui]OXM87474.1 PTS sugar transporter [Paenibacillus rigui]
MSGLPTRVIVEINQAANQFQSSIVLKVDNRHIDVKSILGLSITLLSNQQYELQIHGPDEAEARSVMVELFRKHELSVTLI